MRAFELHQIVNGVDHIANTYYIKDALEAEAERYVRTGVYSNKADVAFRGSL